MKAANGLPIALSLLAGVAAPTSAATTGAASVEVVGSNSQDFVGDFDFQVPTNASGFSGPSVSPSGWVFFTMGVKDADGYGLGDGLFAYNGGTTQVLLGPPELGTERRIEDTIEVANVPRVRATGRDSVLLRATVDGVDGLWDVSPVDGTSELVAEEGVGGLAQIGVLGGSTADQFWGDDRGLVTFVAQPSFVPTVFSYDGKTTTPLLAEGGSAAGTGGVAGELKAVGVSAAGEVIVITPLTVNSGGPRVFDAVLRYTPGLGVEWELLAGQPAPVARGLATIDDLIHIGSGGHIVFRGSYYTDESPPGSGFWNTAQGLMRVSPDGSFEILSDYIDGTDLFAVDATHVTPSGDVYAAVDSFSGGYSDKVLYAAVGDVAEVLYSDTSLVFGSGAFVLAYGFSSADDGRVFISGESSIGQVVVEHEPGKVPYEVISAAWPVTVDGEERAVEALYYEGVGPYVSSNGEVVCARMDLDAPTDVGVACTADPTIDDPGDISGEIVDHRLVRVETPGEPDQGNDVRYEVWVDVDMEVSEGFWQVDLDVLGDTPFEGQVRVLNRLDGQIETTCTPTPQLVRCGEVVATDPVSLQVRMVFMPSSPTSHDLTLTLRGSNDGPEVQLDEDTVLVRAFEQTLEPQSEGVECFVRALATVGAGEEGQLDFYTSGVSASGEPLDPVFDVPAFPTEEGFVFDTSEEGVNIDMPTGRYEAELLPARTASVPDCGMWAEDCLRADEVDFYEVDTSDNRLTGLCEFGDDGEELSPEEKERCRCSATSPGAAVWPVLFVSLLALRRRRGGATRRSSR